MEQLLIIYFLCSVSGIWCLEIMDRISPDFSKKIAYDVTEARVSFACMTLVSTFVLHAILLILFGEENVFLGYSRSICIIYDYWSLIG